MVTLNPTNSTETLDNQFVYEVYTKNPQTGEAGWEIQEVKVIAPTKKESIAILKTFPNFDCVILCSYNGERGY